MDLLVDGEPEAEFVDGLDDDKGWQGDKKAIATFFRKLLSETIDNQGIAIVAADLEAPFVVTPVIHEIESGYYRVPAFLAVSRIYMTVEISAPGEGVIEVVKLQDGVAFDAIANPTSGGRLRSVAKALGRAMAEYLAERVAG